MNRLVAFVFAAACAAGCAPAKRVSKALQPPPKRTEFEQQRFERAIAERRVILGMTRAEVRKARGEPQRRDYVRKFGGIRVRRWVYPWDEVYFDQRGLVIGTHAAYR